MNSTHTVLAKPPRSRLRNRSPKIHHRHMNHAKKMKNSNIASKNEPLSLNMSTASGLVDPGGAIRYGPAPARMVGEPALTSKPVPESDSSDRVTTGRD